MTTSSPGRRLLAAALAAACLLPAAVAAAIALHVAFAHSNGHTHAATPHATAHEVQLVTLAEHGHLHVAGELPHAHSQVVAAAAAVRRGLDSPVHEALAGATAALTPSVAPDEHASAARSRSGPPQASGPPLLARLSTYRI